MAILFIAPLPRRVTHYDLVRWVCEQGGIRSRDVGRVHCQGRQGSLEIPDRWEAPLVRSLDGARLHGKRMRAWSGLDLSEDETDHFQVLARLVQVEAQAEARQAWVRAQRLSPSQAEKRGQSLLGLSVESAEEGLGGRFILKLRKRKRAHPLPWTRLGIGSPVALTSEASHERPTYRGIISGTDSRFVWVALDELPVGSRDRLTWRIDLAHDEAATQRQLAALQRARHSAGDRLAELRDVLMGRKAPAFANHPGPIDFDTRLNPFQQDAVRHALAAQDVALIHGPPGTGKTTTIVEVIRQCLKRGQRVLASAPSNRATDNLLERLLPLGFPVVRLGHPARVLPELRKATLDLQVEAHASFAHAQNLQAQAKSLRRRAERQPNSRNARRIRQLLRQDAQRLETQARRLQAGIAEDVLDHAQVVCTTTTGLDADVLGNQQFDLAVIDEACQGTEPGCWIPLLRSRKVVLAGDHCQLSPTVLSKEAEEAGFGISLFERVHGLFGPTITRRLEVQYRMNEQIMRFSSLEFYENALVSHPSVSEHRLAGLPGLNSSGLTQAAVDYHDTAGLNYREEQETAGDSRYNTAEAVLVTRQVRHLVEAGLPPQDIGVITPYSAQVRLIRRLLPDPLIAGGLEVNSVDGFQGREKEAIVISLVRSNEDQQIGFLSEIRRTNVALTRARRKLIVIGDSETLGADPFYARLFAYFAELGAAGSAERLDESLTRGFLRAFPEEVEMAAFPSVWPVGTEPVPK